MTGLSLSQSVSPVVVCFRADDRADVAGLDLADVLTRVGVHLHEPTDLLLAVLGAVEHLGASLESAGVDPDVGQLADVRVGLDLEGQRGERLGERGGAVDLDVSVTNRDTLGRADVQRAGQVVDDRVEHGLDALVLERGAAQHRGDGVLRGRAEDGPADAGLDLVDRELLLLEVGLHDGVVIVGKPLDELVPPLGRLLGVLGRDLDDVEDVTLARLVVVGPVQALHLDQVDHTGEVALDAPRQLENQRGGVEPVVDHVDGPVEVGTGPVHLVDEADARDGVLVGLAPHGLGLGLDAGDGVEHRDRTVEHPKRPLHLDGEVDVARGVDDVDPVAVPLTGGGSGGDGDAPLLLLLHPVHGGRAVVDLADLVGLARVVENALGRGGLARVDVRHDPDVAGLGECGGHVCCHVLYFLSVDRCGRRADLWVTSGSARRPCCSRPSCACPRGA